MIPISDDEIKTPSNSSLELLLELSPEMSFEMYSTPNEF